MSRRDAMEQGINATTGEIWECGAFRGENALWMSLCSGAAGRTLRVFDTFTGQPFSGPHDTHRQGSMNETCLDTLLHTLSGVAFSGVVNLSVHQGIMPATFASLDGSKASVVNIDVDNYDSVRDCLEYFYPRVAPGSYILLDDYGCPACPGAHKATEEFMAGKPESLIHRGGPQAYFIKA